MSRVLDTTPREHYDIFIRNALRVWRIGARTEGREKEKHTEILHSCYKI